MATGKGLVVACWWLARVKEGLGGFGDGGSSSGNNSIIQNRSITAEQSTERLWFVGGDLGMSGRWFGWWRLNNGNDGACSGNLLAVVFGVVSAFG